VKSEAGDDISFFRSWMCGNPNAGPPVMEFLSVKETFLLKIDQGSPILGGL